MVGKERRAVERFDVRCPVDVVVDDATIRGQLLNLSATGALIALTGKVSLGAEIHISVELPEGAPRLELYAMVIRKAGTSPLRLGLTFILPPPEIVARIRSLIYEINSEPTA